MRCPNCAGAEIPEAADRCEICGYPAERGTACDPAGAEVDSTVRRELLGELHIGRLLARRPWSLLYLARDPARNETVAVKVLARELVTHGEDEFRRRAEEAVALRHPHIIPVYRFGTTSGFHWYTMPRVLGRSLDEQLRLGGRMQLDACLRIVRQVAGGLTHAHRSGVAHGALAPGDIISRADGWTMVGDFALPRLRGRDADPSPRGDQYQLASLVCQCLIGTPLVAGSVDDLARLGLPAPARDALRRALSADPSQRFPSVRELVAALGDEPEVVTSGSATSIVWFDHEPEPPRTTRRVAVAAGLAATVALGALWFSQPAVPESPAAARRPTAPPTATQAQADSPMATTAPDPGPVPAPAATATRATSASPHSSAAIATARPRLRRPGRAAPDTSSTQLHSLTVPVALDTPRVELGQLSVNSSPWGVLYIDGRMVGTTPQVDLPIDPGLHAIRVERPGFAPYRGAIRIDPGQRARLVGIELRRVEP